MATDAPLLQRLDQSDLSLADGQEDLRDRRVVDADGEEVGSVAGLYVDPAEGRVRFLQVKGGGILGIGDAEMIVPVEAVDGFDDETVRLGHARDHVAGAPTYDPALVEDTAYWDDVYGWYGYTPFWSPGLGTYPIGVNQPPVRGVRPGTSEPGTTKQGDPSR